MIRKCLIVFVAVALTCDGQIADYFFPRVAKSSRDIVVGLSRSPLATFFTQTSGNVISAAGQAISWAPIAFARALGVGELPILGNRNNIVGTVDRIVGDFNSGLGNEDSNLPIGSLIRKYGHAVEKHEVVTEDGYVLNMFRIPSNGSIVFLMHGLLGSADDFVIAGPEDGLAYLLAREGYDVWMGNARGNKHSRRHRDLHPNNADFWDFSWHEIGVFDLPAMIDYVLDETEQTSLKYIGHSQGTTAFFVMASERPPYNEKVSLMIALSPVAFVSNIRSPVVRLLAPGTSIIHVVSRSIGIYEFLPDDVLMKALKLMICGTGVLAEIVCGNILFMMCGMGYQQLNFTNLPVVLGHVPSGAATKQLTHFGQGVISRRFRQFDYGNDNLVKYGAREPPDYPLEKISTPISLFYSDEDWLAHPADVDALYNKLNSAVDIHKIPYEQFNHLDFLWAKDFKVLVYKRVKKLLKLYSDNSSNL